MQPFAIAEPGRACLLSLLAPDEGRSLHRWRPAKKRAGVLESSQESLPAPRELLQVQVALEAQELV